MSLVVSIIMPRLHYGNATLAGLREHHHHRLQSVFNAAARLIYQNKSVPARHTSSAGASLAAVPTACRLQTRRRHFPVSPRSGARLFNWRHTSCRRHQSPVSALVVVSSTDCPINAAGDHGRPCLPGCRQLTLEQSTAQHHLCSHAPCFLHPPKNIFISAFFPFLSPNSLLPQWFSSFLTLRHFK